MMKKCMSQEILGEWSNMIGYERASSPARIPTTPKASPVANFQARLKKNDMAANTATRFATWNSPEVKFLEPPQAHLRPGNLASRHLQLKPFFNRFSILSTEPTIASNNQPCLELKFLTNECASSL